jgi:RimJ/RimL family protein N-acetyltransferase
VAHILPGNIASSKLASRLGFSPERAFTDVHGDADVRWVWTVPA